MKHFNIYFLFLIVATLFSCERPGMEYTVQPKQLTVDETTIYVDGFLIEGTPVFEGNENEPADKLAIPFNNGFGKILRIEFLDRTEETGLTIEGRTVELENKGDKQYALFDMSGTPKVSGSIPVSFNIYEGEEQIGQTITKTIPIWEKGTTRPPRELIPTSEKPFILLGGEVNWVNQSEPTAEANKPQEFWYDKMPCPATSVNVSGSKFSCVVNLRYNSIMVANNSVRPDFTGENNAGTLNVFAPTQENLKQYPEAFTLKDGTLSSVWGANDIFYHGTNSKPVSVGMWDENTPDLIVSGNRARPLSSLSWNVSSVKPYGSYIENPGTYKVYVKYNNADAATDVIQYFPKHPVTGEAGWVSYELTITKNPIPGFVIDPGIITNNPEVPTYNKDWEPTEEEPVKAIRGELVYDNKTKILKVGEKLGPNNSCFMRLWFATLKKEGETSPVGYNFKANDDNKPNSGWERGFYLPNVENIAGKGSVVKAGSNNKKTNDKVHFFADEELNKKYFISFVDFTGDQNIVLQTAGTFTFMFDSPANSGTSNPKFANGFKCPVTITAEN